MPDARRARRSASLETAPRKRRRQKPRRTPRARKAKSSKKAAATKKAPPPEGAEPVRHYGQSWEFEHYEKESLKAMGLFL
jgi:hypothetical protein